jgi:hypothetical protein
VSLEKELEAFYGHAQPESTTAESIPSVKDSVIPVVVQPEVVNTSPTPERKTEVKRPGSISECASLPHRVASILAIPSPEWFPSTLVIGKARARSLYLPNWFLPHRKCPLAPHSTTRAEVLIPQLVSWPFHVPNGPSSSQLLRNPVRRSKHLPSWFI